MKTLVSGRWRLSCIPRVRPARPPLVWRVWQIARRPVEDPHGQGFDVRNRVPRDLEHLIALGRSRHAALRLDVGRQLLAQHRYTLELPLLELVPVAEQLLHAGD